MVESTAETLYDYITEQSGHAVPTGNAQNKVDQHSEFKINATAGEQLLYLSFRDAETGIYHIPLGTLYSHEKTNSNDHKNILVPIVPVAYTTPDLDTLQAEVPREGCYIYIYKGDYLWLELGVLKNGHYADVNLHQYQGKDIRPPASEDRDTRILMPFKIAGNSEILTMCISEVQWSWARINTMGGMDPDDIRLNKKNPPLLATAYDITKSKAHENRTARMQEIDLSGYDSHFPTTRASGNKARVENSNSVSSTSYLLKAHAKSDIAVVYLHDSLGIVNAINKDLDTLTSFLDNTLKVISSEKHYKSAVLAYQTFFNDALWKTEDYESPAMSVIDIADDSSDDEYYTDRSAESLDKRRSSGAVDKTLLEKLLQVELRKKIRKEIRLYKKRYVAFMEGKFEGKEITANSSDFISINETLKDYAELEAPAYGLLWQTFSALIHIMPYDPNVNDRALDIKINQDKIKHDDDPGHLYLKEVLKPAHPLHAMLFPDNSQVDEYAPSYKPDSSKIEKVDGTGKFRPLAYAKIVKLAHRSLSPDSNVNKSLKRFQNIIADFSLVMGAQVYDVNSKLTAALEVNPIMRLAIAQNDPDLATLHLVKKGENITKKLVLTGRISIFEQLNQSQHAAQLGKVAANPGIKSGQVNVINPITKKAIGSTLLSQIDNNKGLPEGYNELAWYSLFITPKQSTADASKDDYDNGSAAFTVAAFEKASKSGNKLSQNISKAVSGKTPLADKITISPALPVAIAVFKALNVFASLDSLAKAKSKKDQYKYASKAFLAAASIPFALMEVTKQVVGDEKAIPIWEQRFTKMKMDPIKVRKWATRMFKGSPNLAVKNPVLAAIHAASGLKLASTTFAITGSLMSAYEMVDAAMQDDDDAAVAYGVQMVAGLTYALNAAAAGTEFLVFFAASPWGWASLIVIILAGIIASALIDSDLEKWAKHGPFALTKADRMTEQYKIADSNSTRYVYEALLAILMAPRIKITEADEFIYVDVLAPGFEAGSNTLTIHSRFSDGYRFKEQKPMELISWMPLLNKKFPTKTDGLRYTYNRPNIASQAKLYARVQHITKDNLCIPMKPDQSLGKVADPKLIDEDINGWAYAEPLRIIDEPEDDPDIDWGT